mgnify:CR=1 FL=1
MRLLSCPQLVTPYCRKLTGRPPPLPLQFEARQQAEVGAKLDLLRTEHDANLAALRRDAEKRLAEAEARLAAEQNAAEEKRAAPA